MKVQAILYDRLKDKEVTYEYEIKSKYVDSQEYLWMDGNYSCDDNRGMFVAKVLGEADPNYPCGEDKVILKGLYINGELIAKDTKGMVG